jgi:Tfp pilus assembly protein PilF
MFSGVLKGQSIRVTSRAAGKVLRNVALLSVLLVTILVAVGCSNDLSQARKAEKAGDLASAVSLYQERLRTSPDDLAAVKALAGIFYLERKWDDALPVQEKAVALDPKETQIRVELGFNYLNHQGQPGKAVVVFQEAAALEPTAQYLGFLAQAQLAVGDQQTAEATLRQGLTKDKSYGHTYVLLIPLLERQGRTAEAAQLREAAQSAGVALEALSNTQ